MAKKYTIGHISIDEEGRWWVDFYGSHAQQGGIFFSPGNMGGDDIKSLLKAVAFNIARNKTNYLNMIKKKQREEIPE